MDLARPQDATRVGSPTDPRDRAAAMLVGGATLLSAAGWLFSLLFGAAPIGSRAELLTITGPTGLVRLGFLVAATVLLAGASAGLGRILTAAIAVPTTLGLAFTGLLLVRDAGAPAPLQLWIDGGADLLLLAAAVVVLTVWRDRGWPATDRAPGLGGRIAIAGAVLAVVANAFPPVSTAPVALEDLATLLRRGTLAWAGLLANGLLTVGLVAVGARLRRPEARRLVLLLVGVTGAATVLANAATVLVLRVDVRPTLWAGLAAAGYLAVLLGAYLTGRREGQTSSATA